MVAFVCVHGAKRGLRCPKGDPLIHGVADATCGVANMSLCSGNTPGGDIGQSQGGLGLSAETGGKG